MADRKAMKAIEQAADVIAAEKKDYMKLLVRQIPVEKLYCDIHRTSNDTSLSLNCLEPQLGDRVVNLTSDGVPFGFRGTVITIHSSTNYVEVFINYKGTSYSVLINLNRFSSIANSSMERHYKDRARNFAESCVPGRA